MEGIEDYEIFSLCAKAVVVGLVIMLISLMLLPENASDEVFKASKVVTNIGGGISVIGIIGVMWLIVFTKLL